MTMQQEKMDTDHSINQLVEAVDTPRVPITLGLWNYYFIAKLILFWRELIELHPLENLTFAAFLLIPINSRAGRHIRTLLAIPLGIALLYHDSFLPPIARALSQASLLSSFSFDYLVELLGRFVSWPIVAMLVIAWSVYRIAEQHLRIGIFVIGALLWVTISQLTNNQPKWLATASSATTQQPAQQGTASLDSYLQSFYAKEAQRIEELPKEDLTAAPFDIVFIQICSLSWDDLQATGLTQHRLWKNFDIVLRNFNSAASYSGPAAIRINRALCGQSSHKDLYAPARENCYLMDNLKQAGFTTNLLLNHDGHFDDFLTEVQNQNFHITPMPLNGLPVANRAFDDSPIYDDLAVLNRWVDTRQKSNAPRVAAYYNTVTLHDGNHLVSAPKLYSRDTYKQRLNTFLDELDDFMQQLAHRGRRTIVVVVPEHGAAFHGEKGQISGLREIPSPAITLVPVGIKVIGADGHRLGDAVQIDAPTSYLAISRIISQMLEVSPFGVAGFSAADYVADLPQTEFVAENADNVMLRRNGVYYLNQDKEGWKEYQLAPSMPDLSK